jgi:uroporphyrinogen decarboxylase
MAVFAGQQPDRVPKDLGSTIWTTMDERAYTRLKQHLGVHSDTCYMSLAFSAVEIDEAILRRLDIDTRGLITKGPAGWVDHITDTGLYIDEWGIKRDINAGAAIVEHPFAVPEYSHELLEKYQWPDGRDSGRYDSLRERLQVWHASGEYATVLNVFGGFTTMSYLLRGLDNWCMDMLLDEDLFTDLLDRTLRFEIDSARAALGALGPYVDIVGIADDYAGQDGLLFSPEHFRRFIKPRLAQLVAAIRDSSHARILFHCCGSIDAIIPDFIELGIDALNPFQVTAKGMDPAILKATYHGRMVFWGGIDTQELLPHGTPDQVAAEVRRIAGIMAPGGGYVLGAVHNIQGDVPPENVVGMFDAVGEFV